MSLLDLNERTVLHDVDDAAVSRQTEQPQPSPSFLTSATLIKQEANLLRFPFFALGRMGLRNRKGLMIRGQSKLDDKTYDFEYRITCNSDDLYPGQLSRKVHMGLLRLMQLKQSFPFTNPIAFTWRELMETIGVVASGRTQQQLKQAIRSIEGTRIRSKFALKNAHGNHLKGRERGYGLNSEYVFFDELMPDDKTIADKNFLWLADWYLANINSLYCSPLDHGVWLPLKPDEDGLLGRECKAEDCTPRYFKITVAAEDARSPKPAVSRSSRSEPGCNGIACSVSVERRGPAWPYLMS